MSTNFVIRFSVFKSITIQVMLITTIIYWYLLYANVADIVIVTILV